MEKNGRAEAVKNIGFAKKKLHENKFQVAVMGQLKRGKSSFVNALLRNPKLMPTGLIPVSSAIVSVQHGEKEQITVYFKNGQNQIHPLETIAEFCTEEQNPGNEKNVSRIMVEYQSDWLKDGVIIVDTPGEGSVNAYHDEIVYEFIPKADAILYVFTAELPICRGEFDLLKRISEEGTERIFFVMNKVDAVNHDPVTGDSAEDQLRRGVEYNINVIRKFGKFSSLSPDAVFCISSKSALESLISNTPISNASGFPRLETELRKYLEKQRGAEAIRSGMRAAIGELGQFTNQMQTEKSALNRQLKDLTSEKIRWVEEKEKLRKNLDRECQLFLRSMELCEPHFAGLCAEIKSKTENYITKRISEIGFRDILAVKKRLTEIQSEIENMFKEDILNAVNRSLGEKAIPAMKDLASNLEQLLIKFSEDCQFHFEFIRVDISGFNFLKGAFAGATIITGGASLLGYSLSIGWIRTAWAALAGGTANLWNPLGWGLIAVGLGTGIWGTVKALGSLKEKFRNELFTSIPQIIESVKNKFAENIRTIKSDGEKLVWENFRIMVDPIDKGLAEAERQLAEGNFEKRIEELSHAENEIGTIRNRLMEIETYVQKEML
jgi:GTPase SAR1 family protein